MNYWVGYCAIFAIALAATMALVPLAKRIAWRLDAIDYPDKRRVNKRPVPRLGGIAIFGGMGIAALAAIFFAREFGWFALFGDAARMDINKIGFGASLLAIFLVGAADDIWDLKPKQKFLGQILAACIAAGSGLLFTGMQLPLGGDYIEFGWWAYPITVFYLVAFANVINLIDGLDGLAAGISGISAITIVIFAVSTGRVDAAVLGLAIAGSCIGFLKFNFHPARIFMGDSGALLLGFSLGAVSLLATTRSALFVSLLVPILAAGVPIMDTAFAILRRLRAHKPIDAADKGHIHHKLLDSGFNQRRTVLIMWGWTAVLAACGVLTTMLRGWPRIIIAVIIMGTVAFAIHKLHLLGPALVHHYNPKHVKRPRHEKPRS